jgi:hypothetical protein
MEGHIDIMGVARIIKLWILKGMKLPGNVYPSAI